MRASNFPKNLKERCQYLRIFSAHANLKNYCRSFSSFPIQYGGFAKRLAWWQTKQFWPEKEIRGTKCAEKLGQETQENIRNLDDI